MSFLYNFLIITASLILRIAALFNSKLALFVSGRKETLSILQNNISKNDRIIWIHAASLGEYEQGLPVMEKLKINFPDHKILLTFFSPSGYEVKKNSIVADITCYLPLDIKRNVASFIEAVKPELAIFVKYEIWPNYLAALKNNNTPTILISALFKENQIYFKWYGAFMRKALTRFSHFFVQNEKSYSLLNKIGFKNVTVAGDTRFDRVSEIVERDNTLNFMTRFKQDRFCFVSGSTWPEDEKIITDYINQNELSIKFIIAPHTIKIKNIKSIKNALTKRTICYSELKDLRLEDFDVLIIDTIGLLTKIYSYADVAYVGGGFATGLHNTLEPAVFGIPVIIGPQFNGFAEAEHLVSLKGVIPINNSAEFQLQLNTYYSDENLKKETGQINHDYVLEQKGATHKIMTYVNSILAKTS